MEIRQWGIFCKKGDEDFLELFAEEIQQIGYKFSCREENDLENELCLCSDSIEPDSMERLSKMLYLKINKKSAFIKTFQIPKESEKAFNFLYKQYCNAEKFFKK